MYGDQETKFGVHDDSDEAVVITTEAQLKRYQNGSLLIHSDTSSNENEFHRNHPGDCKCCQDGGFCYSCSFFFCCGWCDRKDRRDCNRHWDLCSSGCWNCCWCTILGLVEAI